MLRDICDLPVPTATPSLQGSRLPLSLLLIITVMTSGIYYFSSFDVANTKNCMENRSCNPRAKTLSKMTLVLCEEPASIAPCQAADLRMQVHDQLQVDSEASEEVALVLMRITPSETNHSVCKKHQTSTAFQNQGLGQSGKAPLSAEDGLVLRLMGLAYA